MTNEELAKRIYSGQNELMGELYTQSYKFILKYCKHFYEKYYARLNACGIELDDLLNESYFALVQAVKAYNEKNGKYKFLSYVKFPLQQMCVTAMGCRRVQDRKNPAFNHVSFYDPIKGTNDEELTIGDTLIDNTANIEDDTAEQMTLSEVFPTVEKLLKDKQRNFEVLKLHYQDGISLSEIGKQYGYSREFIRRLKESAFRQLRKSKNKKLLSLRDEIIGASYHMGGLGWFKRTNQSSVEWSVIKMNENN